MTRITVTLTEEQDARLREQAEARRLPVSELVRAVLDEAIDEWDRKRGEPPPFLGLLDIEFPFSAADAETELAKIVAES